ncbi:hypothetical protein [Halobellus marinus]|jgi:hypothetical protein|uniref:hypothetical protein n=1 Tax=Halobellus TaxID=1073986 RepID=UPI0028AFB04B|nr:hypothetical protein [Halobellus sp. DFY28]
MAANLAVLFGGPFTSLPGLVGTLLVVLLVLVVGRVLLALAWRVVLVALAVSVGLWALGLVGLSPI